MLKKNMVALSTESFTRDEEEILEEVMNIAFGSASAELGHVIDICISLNVPEVSVTDLQAIPDYFLPFKENSTDIQIIQQNFWGDFAGRSFLVVSGSTGNDLVGLTEGHPSGDETMARAEIRHNGVLLEIGNILMGACIGKIAELLTTVVTYSPPVLADTDKSLSAQMTNFCDPRTPTITIKAHFSFDDRATNGLLLTITRPESIAWMKDALAAFMGSYE